MSSIFHLIFLATLVYRYEFTPSGSTEPVPQGTPMSAYLEFLEPGGEEHGLGALYDLQFVTNRGFENGIERISPFAFRLPDARLRTGVFTTGLFTWNETRVGGDWELLFGDGNVDPLYGEANSGGIECFFPITFFFHESARSGSWLFTQARSVPEAGGTLLYLAIGMIAFIWRKP